MNTCWLNPAARRTEATGLFSVPERSGVARFFASRPDLRATPLHRLDALAGALGIGSLLLKDENGRFGLPAFKILGVTHAVHRLRETGMLDDAATLACASTGNHGRAVAHAARAAGLAAAVYVPAGTAQARLEAIAAEGADVTVFDGSYDAAVRQLAADAGRNAWTIVSDTSWPGYEEIPRWIMAGYTRLMDEAADAWPAVPDVVLVQAGVGGLACAVASWLASRPGAMRPFLVVCEPATAACVLASARERRPVALDGPLETAMAGLRCAEPSPLALGPLLATADAFVAIDDEWTFEAMRRLGAPPAGDVPVAAGPSGACGVGALLAILQDPHLHDVRQAAGLGPASRVLAINTEAPSS